MKTKGSQRAVPLKLVETQKEKKNSRRKSGTFRDFYSLIEIALISLLLFIYTSNKAKI